MLATNKADKPAHLGPSEQRAQRERYRHDMKRLEDERKEAQRQVRESIDALDELQHINKGYDRMMNEAASLHMGLVPVGFYQQRASMLKQVTRRLKEQIEDQMQEEKRIERRMEERREEDRRGQRGR